MDRFKNRFGHDTTVESLSPAISFLLQCSQLAAHGADKILCSVDLLSSVICRMRPASLISHHCIDGMLED